GSGAPTGSTTAATTAPTRGATRRGRPRASAGCCAAGRGTWRRITAGRHTATPTCRRRRTTGRASGWRATPTFRVPGEAPRVSLQITPGEAVSIVLDRVGFAAFRFRPIVVLFVEFAGHRFR